MSGRQILTVLAILAMLNAACFDEPATPLQHSRLDSHLLGQWDCSSADASSDDRALLTVLPFDGRQSYAEWKEGEKVWRYRAYPGDLRRLSILNLVEEPESPNQSWSALRAALPADGTMSLVVPAKRITDIMAAEPRLRTV